MHDTRNQEVQGIARARTWSRESYQLLGRLIESDSNHH